MKKGPRVSLCMIARDEAATIARALDAARPFVDEMIVVDTGSADDTRAIAMAHGARVIDEPWADDFAKARNKSLDAATGDFALVLDADEFMDARSGREMREAVRRHKTYGVFLPIINRFEDGRVIPTLIMRCFVLRKDLRFKNRIHEQVIDALNEIAVAEGGKLIKVEGEVTHVGYRKEIVASRQKNERNRRIFELAVADDPTNVYLAYKFADFLRQFPEESERARAILQKAAEDVAALPKAKARDLPFAGEIFALLAQLTRDAGDPRRGLEIAEQGFAVTDVTTNLRFIRASLAVDLGDARTAAREFRNCREAHGKVLVIPAQPGVTSTLSGAGLARALQMLEEHDAARAAIETVMAEVDDRNEALDFWLECSRRSGQLNAAFGFITGWLTKNPSDSHAWFVGGQLLFAAQMFAEARKWLARAAADPNERDAARGWIAESFVHECNLDEALAAAAAAPSDPRAQAVIAAVSVAADVEVPSLVHHCDVRVKDAFRTMVRNLQMTAGAPVAARLDRARTEMKVFDPAGMELVVDAFAVA